MVAPLPDESNECRFKEVYTAIGTALQTMCKGNWKYQYRVRKRLPTEACTETEE
jgi:hypothetical protein